MLILQYSFPIKGPNQPLHLVLLIALSICACGCASEAQRYTWNRTHPHLCPNARGLTDRDIDEIARVMAHATPQIIMAISAPRHSLQKLQITTCYPGATERENPDRGLFGHCTLAQAGGPWK